MLQFHSREYRQFNFRTPKYTTTCGHFMQIVWDPTSKLGAGIAYAHGKTWIVARYTPAEEYNFVDSLREHVHIPKGNFK